MASRQVRLQRNNPSTQAKIHVEPGDIQTAYITLFGGGHNHLTKRKENEIWGSAVDGASTIAEATLGLIFRKVDCDCLQPFCQRGRRSSRRWCCWPPRADPTAVGLASSSKIRGPFNIETNPRHGLSLQRKHPRGCRVRAHHERDYQLEGRL